MDRQTDRQTEATFKKMNRQGYFLTYATHINKKRFVKWVHKLSTIRLLEIMIGHETSDTGYEHTHICLWYCKPIQVSHCRKFDFEDIHPNIQTSHDGTIMRYKDMPAVYAYISKQDQEPYSTYKPSDPRVVSLILEAEDELEAVSYVRSAAHVPGALAAFNLIKKRKRLPVKDGCMLPWQSKIYNIITEPAEDRKCIWIYDVHGNSGKSWLGRYCRNNIDNCKVMKNVMPQRDLGMIVDGSERICWWDLSRNFMEREGVYDGMEAIKDCLVTTGKYGGKEIVWEDYVHVLVTANFPPHFKSLTSDRWEYYLIMADGRMVEGLVQEQMEEV